MARDGNEALPQYSVERPDIVLTDFVMPDQEGLETIRELVQRDVTLPIIAMSGGGRTRPDDYLRLARTFGAAALLRKPFSMQELEEVLSHLDVLTADSAGS